METKQSQKINISIEEIKLAISQVDRLLGNPEIYGIYTKSRGYDIWVNKYNPEILTIYAYYKLLSKFENNLSDMVKNYIVGIIPIDDLDDSNTYNFSKKLDNDNYLSGNTFIGGSYKSDFGKLLSDLEVNKKVDIYNNYTDFQAFIKAEGYQVSKTNLLKLLKGKGYTEDYIEEKMKYYLVPIEKEEFKFNTPIILNGLDVNETYECVYSGLYNYDGYAVTYDFETILEVLKSIQSRVKLCNNIFNKLKKVLKTTEEANDYDYYYKTSINTAIDDMFYTIEGDPMFIIHYLMQHFNIRYDEIKEFFNKRSTGSSLYNGASSGTYINGEQKVKFDIGLLL